MKKSKLPAPKTAPRRKAAVKPVIKKNNPSELCEQETKRLIAELETHRIELEMQNDEPRKIQEDFSESNHTLRESEEEFRTMFELSAVGMVQVDVKTNRFVRSNRKFCELTGYTEAELRQLTIQELTHPGDRVRDLDTIQRAIRGETAGWVSEKRYIRKNGDALWVKVTGAVISDDRGRPVRLVGAIEDITSRRQVDEALRDSEERYRLIAETSSDVIFQIDAQGRVAYVSPAVSRYGYKPEGIAGTPFTDYIDPSDISEATEAFRRAASGQRIDMLHLRLLGADRAPYDTEINIAPVLRGGEVVAVQGISRDITVRKGLETALKQTNSDLETVNKELEAFSFTVANDLRAPLRTIEGFARAILEDYADRLDATATDHFRRIREATRRMDQYIEAMWTMSRLTRGELAENVVDLHAIAQEIAADLQRKQPERNVAFVIADGAKVKGDRQMLRVALENLLENAWKFTSKHETARIEFGVITDFRFRNSDFGIEDQKTGQQSDTSQSAIQNPKSKIVYFVRDDGAGFDMNFADKLFQPFHRLHTDTEFPGIGIGLAIAHTIIRRHGGRMWAEAGVEKGATFYFTL